MVFIMDINCYVANKFLLVIIICVVHSICNAFFVVENIPEGQFYCITNTSYALSWIDEEGNELFNQVSDFIPSHQKSIWNVSCKDGQLWKCKREISNQLIFDRRWEEMTVYQTKYLTNKGSKELEYITVADNLKTNFEIPFSLRIASDAHIYLCDGNNVDESNCYLIMMQGFKGARTIIRKCSKEEIPNFSGVFTLCSKAVAEVNHVTKILPYLSKQSWSYLKLSKINNKLSLSITNNNDPFIHYYDNDTIRVTHMMIESKFYEVGLWKIHELEYLHTTRETTRVQLGPVIHPINGAVCISMFIDMCYFCRIKFQLIALEDKTIIFKEEIYKFQAEWREIQIRQDNIYAEQVILLVTTFTNKENNDTYFWSIGYIKQCHHNGFRMIKLDERAKCQLISDKYKNDIISLQDNEILEMITIDGCKEDAVSNYCVPCSWFMEKECGSLKICEIKNHKMKCSCSAGYSNRYRDYYYYYYYSYHPAYCRLTCDRGYYGHNCHKTCGNCINRNCNHVNGICGSCTNNYGGSKCDIPPAKIIVTDITCTEASVKVTNFNASDERINSGATPKVYIIHCQTKNNNTNKELTFVKENFKFDEENRIIMTGLEPNTRYFVNCFLTANGTHYYDNRIPTTNFSTICEGQVANLIITGVTQSSVELSWMEPLNNDELIHYIVNYKLISYMGCSGQNGTNNSPGNVSTIIAKNNYIKVSNLVPYSKYIFVVSAMYKKIQGSPNTVQQSTFQLDKINSEEVPTVKIIKSESRKVWLKFNSVDCSKIRGPLQIQITAECYTDWCANNVTNQTDYNARVTTHNLNNLTPFSNYTLQIVFCRKQGNCLKTKKTLNFYTEPEAPGTVKFLQVYSKNFNSISLMWRPPHPPTGILEFYHVTYCIDGESKHDNISINTSNLSHCTFSYEYYCWTLSNLEEKTHYFITIQGKNKNIQLLGESVTTNATTTVAKPYDLSIYWTLENELELKWKYPTRTNGDLQFLITIKRFFASPNETPQQIPVPVLQNDDKLNYNLKIPPKNDTYPSTKYNITILAINNSTTSELNGQFMSPPSIPLFETQVNAFPYKTRITVEIPPIIKTIETGNIYKLLIFITDKDTNVQSHPALEEFEDSFSISLNNFRVVFKCDLLHFNISKLTIGNGDGVKSCNDEPNPPLVQETDYNITVIVTNTFKNTSRHKIYSLTVRTTSELLDLKSKFPVIVVILVLIGIIVTIGWRIYVYIKKKKSRGSDNHNHNEQIPLTCQTQQRCDDDEKIYSTATPIEQFREYVHTALQSGVLVQQHKTILSNAITKNYETVKGDLFWNYMDVNFVNGDNIDKAYIVTEMPNSSNANVFWRIVCDENIEHVVVFENTFNPEKQEFLSSYWFVKNEKLEYGNISVQQVFCETFANYEQKTIELICGKEKRQVNFLCFSSWLDTEIPNTALIFVPFLQKLANIPLKSKSPILVYCSSGMEGAGFTLLCDICLRTAKIDGLVDVFNVSQMLANCTTALVNSRKHYLFAHLVILENLMGLDTGISCISFDAKLLNVAGTEEIRQKLNYVKDMQWLDQTVKTLKRQYCRNQNSALTEPYASTQEHEYTYIDTMNVVTVDGFRCPNKFIVIPQPMNFSVANFWKLIEEKGVSIVVSMNDEDLSSFEHDFWWPTDICPQMNPSKSITVQHNLTKTFKNYVWTTVSLTTETKSTTVEIFSMRNWPVKMNCPDNVQQFVNFCVESSKISRSVKPIVITCLDGIKASGLYLTMSYIIEKMKVEDICDVCSSVRIAKSQRQEFLNDDEQFTFLCKAAENYLQETQLYET